MNKIERHVYGLVSIAKKAGVELPFEASELIAQLEDGCYKNNDVESLVNIGNLNGHTIDISEMAEDEDYEILTGVRTNSDGEEFETQEEYNEYIKGLIEENFESYSIESYQDGFRIIDNESAVVEDGFKTEDEAYERLDELKESFANEQEIWECLNIDYDEVGFNIVQNFGGCSVGLESAVDAGLGVLHVDKLDRDYLFLTGCGMDFSFSYVKYLAYEHGFLNEDYVGSLEWTKLNTTDTEYKRVLEKLGVDVNRLSNI